LLWGWAHDLEGGKGLVSCTVVKSLDPVGPGDSTLFKTILLLNKRHVISVGWVKVVLAGHEFENNGVFLGFEECRVAKGKGDECGARL